jgi:hypothetical protein
MTVGHRGAGRGKREDSRGHQNLSESFHIHLQRPNSDLL